MQMIGKSCNNPLQNIWINPSAFMIPRDGKHPGIIMELKSGTGLSEEALETLSVEALHQINCKRYDTDMRNDGIENILKLGIAFSGKIVKIHANELI